MRKCIRKEDSKEFAVKIVNTRDDEIISQLINEFKNLSKLNHPNIVKVYELYIDYDHGKVYSLQELIRGKEMFAHISSLGNYTGRLTSYQQKRRLRICLNSS